MKFSDIPGLDATKEKLSRAANSGKVAHAQLFAGQEGSANLTMALAYAALLNCDNPLDGDACGECPSCQKIHKAIHPDVHFIFPVSTTKKKTKNVNSDTFIEAWRSFIVQNPYGGAFEWAMEFGGEDKQLNISREESRNIIKKLALKAFEGRYKIMIIWGAEYMHPTAANALLKLFEEPPANTVFLLVTNDKTKILGTIISRTQLLAVRPFNNDEIASYLQQKFQLPTVKTKQMAAMAMGNLNQALKLVNEVQDDTQQMFEQWMRICFSRQLVEMTRMTDEFFGMGKINQKGLLLNALSNIHESLMSQHGIGGEIPFNVKFASAVSFQKLSKLYDTLNTAMYHLERNGNARIIFLDTSLQIAAFLKT